MLDQVASIPQPKGLTIPIPVTTTRRNSIEESRSAVGA
jgi:hypothetical protein